MKYINKFKRLKINTSFEHPGILLALPGRTQMSMQREKHNENKLIPLQDAAGFFRIALTIMVGGFMGLARPPAKQPRIEAYWVIQDRLIANDTAFVDTGISGH